MDDMKLNIIRYSSEHDDTLGIMLTDGRFECFTLEDEFRSQKVFAETRIDAGIYEIVLYTQGRLHAKYSDRYPIMHKGMLLFVSVPKFTGIMFHTGVDDDDTAGCVLVGDGTHSNVEEKGKLIASAHAYKRFYPKVATHLLSSGKVFCEVTDYA